MRANRTFVKVKYTSSMEELLSSSFHHDGESNPSVPIHGGGVLGELVVNPSALDGTGGIDGIEGTFVSRC